MNRLLSSHAWLLDVRDLNNGHFSFQKPAQMKIHPHYSWHQTGLGARRGLICSWMWDAAETVACLACVCVAEVVEGWRRKGYQWATAGVPQSQRSTCCYHNWQAGPQPQTNGLSLRLKLRLWTRPTRWPHYLHVCLLIRQSPSCQLVSSAVVFHVSLFADLFVSVCEKDQKIPLLCALHYNTAWRPL